MPRKPPHILVVDDDMVTCELLCEVFVLIGVIGVDLWLIWEVSRGVANWPWTQRPIDSRFSNRGRLKLQEMKLMK